MLVERVQFALWEQSAVGRRIFWYIFSTIIWQNTNTSVDLLFGPSRIQTE